MKFKFTVQQYQTDAVNAVMQVFNGQPKYEPLSYIRDLGKNYQQSLNENDDIGYKNAVIQLSDNQLLNNIRKLQSHSNIKMSDKLIKDLGTCSLDVEMETGTGKTYVYIKTMFELNKRYGWSKFIIVVPSIAIREGVKKSFEVTAEHFQEHYNKKARFFIYNSANLTELDRFSSSSDISVMIINTQAFATSLKEGANNKEARIIYSKRDNFQSRRPIDVIAANRPIIILDEPQKMGGTVTQNALKKFAPLFSLNYSATHTKQHNLIYVLDALDAYNQQLVKKIEVKGFDVKNHHGIDNYLFLESIILSSKKPPMARIEFEVKYSDHIKRETRILGADDDLFSLSKNMEQYKGYRISEVDPIRNTVTFTNGEIIHTGEVIGDISETDIRRVQIRETIRSHFEKEKELYSRGIKTLSLFFIDEVAKYRKYDENGNEMNALYGEIFEQEYTDILNEYITLYDTPYEKYLKSIEVSRTHAGYFSIDKKGHKVDSTLKRGKDESDDISAYDLILKDKERLLSFENPVRFIFSHSALREGWDNPNVFQICTLKHGGSSATQKRQEVGRGLRLCVDKNGDRMDKDTLGNLVQQVNQLTVIASDGYKSFVQSLQEGIREDLYERPTQATAEYFIGKTIKIGGTDITITEKQGKDIYRYLVRNNYVDDDDKITEQYRADSANGVFAELPESCKDISDGVHALIKGIFDKSILDNMVSDGHETKVRENTLNNNFWKKEFQTLWNYINHKYAYTVEFDSEELIEKAVEHINNNMFVAKLQYTVTTGQQNKSLEFETQKSRTYTLDRATSSSVKYDLIGKIAESTKLTRKSVAKILSSVRPDVFSMFVNNPEEFITKAIRLIDEQKATMIVDHISYNLTDSKYDSDIFTAEKNSDLSRAYRSKKNIQDYVFTDGYAKDGKSIERRFAEDMDIAEEVCVYAKLPKGFSIPTPVGNYSPDWAIAFYEGTVKHIYFIAETKGTMDSLNLKPIEKAKIECAEKLFSQISGKNVVYERVDNYQHLLDIMNK